MLKCLRQNLLEFSGNRYRRPAHGPGALDRIPGNEAHELKMPIA
jgi:hypothetical protein